MAHLLLLTEYGPHAFETWTIHYGPYYFATEAESRSFLKTFYQQQGSAPSFTTTRLKIPKATLTANDPYVTLITEFWYPDTYRAKCKFTLACWPSAQVAREEVEMQASQFREEQEPFIETVDEYFWEQESLETILHRERTAEARGRERNCKAGFGVCVCEMFLPLQSLVNKETEEL